MFQLLLALLQILVMIDQVCNFSFQPLFFLVTFLEKSLLLLIFRLQHPDPFLNLLDVNLDIPDLILMGFFNLLVFQMRNFQLLFKLLISDVSFIQDILKLDSSVVLLIPAVL